MSYLTIALIRQDPWVRDRAIACAATEGVDQPEQWVMDRVWALAAQPGWSNAWESAVASNTEPGYLPGRDEAVITDAMILAAVQSIGT